MSSSILSKTAQRNRQAGTPPLRVLLREDKQSAVPAETLAKAVGISPVTAKILMCRGLQEPEVVRAFLFPSMRENLPDPSSIKNICCAAALIAEAVAAKTQLALFSDFDVDGLTGAAQLFDFLNRSGAIVSAYVPNRFVEGYGLSRLAVEKLAASGAKLLITIDCGISSHRELFYAKQLGLKTIVIDHHQPDGNLPAADVVVDPEQDGCPFAEYKLCASGLVWMLLVVLRKKMLELSGSEQPALPGAKDYLDLAALGTICDMVPLVGINRLLAHRGLEALHKSTRPGLLALKHVAGFQSARRLSCSNVAFALGPRINAAGRLSDANEVLTMLTTSDPAKADTIARSLDRLNAERKSVEETVLSSCLQQLSCSKTAQDLPAVVIYDKEYHAGVIGIVAQRLVEQFQKPAAVMAPGEMVLNGELTQVVKGSVRSVKGVSAAAVLKSLSGMLLAHGGHDGAGGFTVSFDKLEEFKTGFCRAVGEILGDDGPCREVLADVRVALGVVDYELANELARLAPFGIGNPSPLLVSEDLTVETASVIGQNHLRLRLSDGDCVRNAVAWGMYGHPLLRKGEKVNAAYTPEINTYQGLSSVQLNLKAVWR